jgi:hypothetical protein
LFCSKQGQSFPPWANTIDTSRLIANGTIFLALSAASTQMPSRLSSPSCFQNRQAEQDGDANGESLGCSLFLLIFVSFLVVRAVAYLGVMQNIIDMIYDLLRGLMKITSIFTMLYHALDEPVAFVRVFRSTISEAKPCLV